MKFFPQNFCLQNNSEINASLHDLKVFRLFFLSLFSKYVYGLGKTIAGNILGFGMNYFLKPQSYCFDKKSRDFSSCYWHFSFKHHFVIFVIRPVCHDLDSKYVIIKIVAGIYLI